MFFQPQGLRSWNSEVSQPHDALTQRGQVLSLQQRASAVSALSGFKNAFRSEPDQEVLRTTHKGWKLLKSFEDPFDRTLKNKTYRDIQPSKMNAFILKPLAGLAGLKTLKARPPMYHQPRTPPRTGKTYARERTKSNALRAAVISA